MIDPEFGKRFSELLDNVEISNTELNNILGISKNNLSNYKKGQIPNATTLYKLSQFFGKSMEYIIAGKEAADLSPEEQQLVNYYRTTNTTGKAATLATARTNSELMPKEAQSSDSKIG